MQRCESQRHLDLITARNARRGVVGIRTFRGVCSVRSRFEHVWSWPEVIETREYGNVRATHHVRSQVDAENSDGTERQRDVAKDERQEGWDLGDVRGEGVRDGFLQVVEDQSSLLDTGHDRGEVVIEQNHVGRLLGHVRTSDTHCYTDVGLLQRGWIVHTVTWNRSHQNYNLDTRWERYWTLKKKKKVENLYYISVIYIWYTSVCVCVCVCVCE